MRPATKRRLRALGYKSYAEYCRSPVWIARRTRYFKLYPKVCVICGATKKIHLHHCNYDRVGGFELDTDLAPLCSGHHRGLHGFMKRKRVKLEHALPKYKRWLATRR